MCTSIRLSAVVGLVLAVAACEMSPQEEHVVAEPAHLTAEPTYTGKY